ncbi:MAG: hypothetical protein Q4G59_03035 [Planctomycetia bacterium]|nr:hypothetical protein [Planctomycetia bacterium]
MNQQKNIFIIISTVFVFLLTIPCVNAVESEKSSNQLNLSALTEPILHLVPEAQRPSKFKVCYRDPAVWYENGKFYFFFTLIEMDDKGAPYSFVATTVSSDLIHFEPIRKLTPCDLALNYGSPGNVVRYNNEYCLCVQTYCQENGERYGNANSRVWLMRSQDLRNWSAPELLRVKGDDVPQEKMGRMIDPYLIEDRAHPGLWWCFYKQNGVSISSSRDLKHWTFHRSVACGENVCILYDDSTQSYRLWNSPQNGIGEMRSKNLTDWVKVDRLITLGQKEWPWARGRLTAAVVLDLRKEKSVGKALMFFHASEKTEQELFPHGTCLGIAWSDDLEQWTWPGKSR